jgi:SAM-dependent methyltransferase
VQQLDVAEGAAVLVIGCGDGQGVQWLARRMGTDIEGVDPDPDVIRAATARARTDDVRPSPTYQAAPVSDLPYEAGVFDAVLVDLASLGPDAAQAAVAEAVKVTKNKAPMYAFAPVWVGEPSPEQRARVGELGFRPRYVMEWKQLLRESGLVELTVEEVTGEWLETSFLLTLVRGWKIARWWGARVAFSAAYRALRGAVARGTLQLSLIWGTRWPDSE